MASGIYLTNEFKCCTFTCTLVRGRNKRLFPILHIKLVPQGWIQSTVDSIRALLREVRCDSLLPGARMHGLLLSSRFGEVSSKSGLRPCPNVETNTEGFHYSGNCSMLMWS